jgi:hypothetical protein
VPGEKQRGAKTLTLSLRLDPKTKFILDFVARIKGQSITTVVERAIKETADGLGISSWDEDSRTSYQATWSNFWDPSDGVRTLRLLANSGYPTTFDEDELKAFTLAHWQFFYLDRDGDQPKRVFIDILWPKIDKYLEIWREKKSSDYWAAGEAMKADLAAARVAGPDWPPKPTTPAKPARRDASSPLPDFDDEIPF